MANKIQILEQTNQLLSQKVEEAMELIRLQFQVSTQTAKNVQACIDTITCQQQTIENLTNEYKMLKEVLIKQGILLPQGTDGDQN